jgi:hypothetical protein
LAEFIHDKDSKPITGIVENGRHGVVRTANRIAAHGLELFETPDMKAIWNGHPDARMAFVITGALDFHRFAVEQETALGIEGDGSETEGIGDLVNHLSPDLDGRADRIENRMFAGP